MDRMDSGARAGAASDLLPTATQGGRLAQRLEDLGLLQSGGLTGKNLLSGQGGGSDILLGGSSMLFRRYKQEGLLDDDMLATIAGHPVGRLGLDVGAASAQLPVITDYNTMMSAGKGPRDSEERNSLLNALTPLRDRFLALSFETIMKPVEQMFPNVEGYTNAIPSKHDVASFMRIVQVELDRAIHGGEITLATLILRGVVKAVSYLSTKVEGMVYTSKSAFLYGAGGRWTPTAEQEHNLQLLQLVAVLHEQLSRLPTAIFGTQNDDGMDHVSLATRQAKQKCSDTMRPALKALDDVVKHQILRPASHAIACALERNLARMHEDHFGAEGKGAGKDMGTDDASSPYLQDFQSALESIRREHISR